MNVRLLCALLSALVVAATVGSRSVGAYERPSALTVPLPNLSTQAVNMTPQAALARLFLSGRILEDWFAPEFLAEVPVAAIEQILAQVREQLGEYQGVSEEGERFAVNFSRGVLPARIALGPDGRIIGLLFEPPRPRAAEEGLERALEGLRALPGRVSVLIVTDGIERAAINADTPLAVGSAFKLSILAALNEQIAAGQRNWNDVVELRPEWRSLPSGILQGWPDGAPVTLYSLAALMISLSDNTATDALLSIVGRDAVERFVPERNRPLLSTRDLFILKTPANADLLERYRAADEEGRRALLVEAAGRRLPAVSEFPDQPTAFDVGWFYTARELCEAMARVAGLPMMAINPGLADPRDWARVAYKGGSEPGVINFTHWLDGRDGRRTCVIVTWNDTMRVDLARLSLLTSTLLVTLQGQ